MKGLFISAVAVIVAFLAYIAMLPPVGFVSRSATIAAPASAIFSHVNDFHKWEAWSPWAKIDPNAKSTFEGPVSGVGATFGWAGNSEIGKGKMTIVESKPSEHIKIKLDFEEPMAGSAIADFTFKPEGGKTVVTWQMTGVRPIAQRIICTLLRAEAMMGEMLNKGLLNLAAVAAAKS